MLGGVFGESLRIREPVAPMIAEKLPVTLNLALFAMAFSLVIGIPAGIVSAIRKGTAWDLGANAAALSGISIPNFWLGIMLILFFSVRLNWLPASGFVPLWESPLENLQRMIMPAFVLGP